MRGKSLVVANLKALMAVDRIDAKQRLTVALDDSHPKVGCRRSADDAVRLGHPRAPDDCTDGSRVAPEELEKGRDLGAVERRDGAVEKEESIERAGDEGDADEALVVGMPSLPGPEESEVDRFGDRRTVGGDERRRDGEGIVGAEGQAHLRIGRADDERLSCVPENRHTSGGEGLEHRPGFGQGRGDRRVTDPLDHPPRRGIEARPVAEDRLQRGDRPTARRGKQRPRNGEPVEGEARHHRHPIPIEQRYLEGHSERTGPEIPGQE